MSCLAIRAWSRAVPNLREALRDPEEDWNLVFITGKELIVDWLAIKEAKKRRTSMCAGALMREKNQFVTVEAGLFARSNSRLIAGKLRRTSGSFIMRA